MGACRIAKARMTEDQAHFWASHCPPVVNTIVLCALYDGAYNIETPDGDWVPVEVIRDDPPSISSHSSRYAHNDLF